MTTLISDERVSRFLEIPQEFIPKNLNEGFTFENRTFKHLQERRVIDNFGVVWIVKLPESYYELQSDFSVR